MWAKQFLFTLIVNIIHQYATNKQFIQLSLTFVALFMHLRAYFFMHYIIQLYLVLGKCTRVHLQCTWIVPKYISQNMLYLNMFNVLELVPSYWVHVLAPTLKMSYRRFVGAAILLLADVFRCADCVDNIIINDIPCVKRKELGAGISKWFSNLNNNLDKSIADCLLVRGTFFVVLLVVIFGISILLLKIHQESRLFGPCNHSLLESISFRWFFYGVFSWVFSSFSP